MPSTDVKRTWNHVKASVAYRFATNKRNVVNLIVNRLGKSIHLTKVIINTGVSGRLQTRWKSRVQALTASVCRESYGP